MILGAQRTTLERRLAVMAVSARVQRLPPFQSVVAFARGQVFALPSGKKRRSHLTPLQGKSISTANWFPVRRKHRNHRTVESLRSSSCPSNGDRSSHLKRRHGYY